MNTESQKPTSFNGSIKYLRRKRHTIPYIKSYYRNLVPHNEAIDASYMQLLAKVKELYAYSNIRYYEYNSRTDIALNCTTMHSFITASVYLILECDFIELKCYVHYDFDDCPFEQEIRKLLEVYPLSTASKHSPQEGGVAAYFTRVLAFQGDKHFYFF